MTRFVVAATMAAIVAAAASPAAAPAAPNADRRADRNAVPEATPVGKPVSCLPLNQIQNQRIYNDKVIDFFTNGGRVYRNILPMSCPSLGFEQRFIHRTSIGELCSLDLITVLQSPPSIPGATCGLGKFQQVILPKRARR